VVIAILVTHPQQISFAETMKIVFVPIVDLATLTPSVMTMKIANVPIAVLATTTTFVRDLKVDVIAMIAKNVMEMPSVIHSRMLSVLLVLFALTMASVFPLRILSRPHVPTAIPTVFSMVFAQTMNPPPSAQIAPATLTDSARSTKTEDALIAEPAL